MFLYNVFYNIGDPREWPIDRSTKVIDDQLSIDIHTDSAMPVRLLCISLTASIETY